MDLDHGVYSVDLEGGLHNVFKCVLLCLKHGHCNPDDGFVRWKGRTKGKAAVNLSKMETRL